MVEYTGIYIAGPMTGYKNFNFDAFYTAEKYLKSMGYADVGNPAAWDHETYGPDVNKSETGNLADATNTAGFDLRPTLLKDATYIATRAGSIFMLEGWEASKGARMEHALAVALGLRVIYQSGV